jgi:hypothetical protein
MSNADPDAVAKRLGWHWLWFLPLCVTVLSLVERHSVIFAFTILKLSYQRWDWGALFSPSAYLCLSAIEASVDLPLRGLWVVALIVKSTDELGVGRRWLFTVLIIIGIFLVPLIAEIVMWGSFPFIIDNQGISRMRMIPFIPWPAGQYGEY